MRRKHFLIRSSSFVIVIYIFFFYLIVFYISILKCIINCRYNVFFFFLTRIRSFFFLVRPHCVEPAFRGVKNYFYYLTFSSPVASLKIIILSVVWCDCWIYHTTLFFLFIYYYFYLSRHAFRESASVKSSYQNVYNSLRYNLYNTTPTRFQSNKNISNNKSLRRYVNILSKVGEYFA